MTLQENARARKILVSLCLLGEPVRYDGTAATCHSPIIGEWKSQDRVVPICPEIEGGCKVPRPPAEIRGGDGVAVLEGKARVFEIDGRDATEEYLRGAQRTLQVARSNDVAVAVLKARSPSCGKGPIYDGTFTCTLRPGMGVTAALLAQSGIRVFDEAETLEAEEYILQLEQDGLGDTS